MWVTLEQTVSEEYAGAALPSGVALETGETHIIHLNVSEPIPHSVCRLPCVLVR